MNPSFDLCELPRLFENALLPAIRLHQAWGLPMAVWENDEVVWKTPDEIERRLRASRPGSSLENGAEKTPANAAGN
jgi:hypothetical protein